MAEPKKKPVPREEPKPAEPSLTSTPLADLLPREQLEELSTLQLVDLITSKLPPRHASIFDMVYLRERIAALEEMNDQARAALEKMDAIIEKLRSPAFRVGTFLAAVDKDKAHVCLGGTDYVCRVDPALPLTSLQAGQQIGRAHV